MHSFRTLLGDLATLTRNTVLSRTDDADCPDHPDASAASGVQPAGDRIGRRVDRTTCEFTVISTSCVKNSVKFGLGFDEGLKWVSAGASLAPPEQLRVVSAGGME